MFIGRNRHFLRALFIALGLPRDEVIFAQNETDVANCCVGPAEITLVLMDMFYISQGGGPVMTEIAAKQLRSLGYTGMIGACSDNPIINGYLAKFGANFACGHYDGDERDCPPLTMAEIVTALEPYLPR